MPNKPEDNSKGPQTERWPQSEFKQLTYAVATPLGERSVKARAAERRVPLREKDAKQVAQDAKKVAQADPAPPTDRLDTVRELRFFDESRLPMPSRNGPARKAQACASPAQHQRQPALITNHVSLAAEDVLGRLRARWAQENSFRGASYYPIPRGSAGVSTAAGADLPPGPPVRRLAAQDRVQPETCQRPALAVR